MKKITILISLIIAIIFTAYQSAFVIGKAQTIYPMSDLNQINNSTLQIVDENIQKSDSYIYQTSYNDPGGHQSSFPDAGGQIASQQEETLLAQKLNDALKVLKSNTAGAKYAQYIKDNAVQVVWGDCSGAMGCASGNTIILEKNLSKESPELISGFITHEAVHVMTPADEGSSLYEEYLAFEAEDQVREGYSNNAGFALQGGVYQLNNDDFTGHDPRDLKSLLAWFKETRTYWQEYEIELGLPAYPPTWKQLP